MNKEKAFIALNRLEKIARQAATSLVPYYTLAKWTWATSKNEPLTADDIEDTILNLIRSLKSEIRTWSEMKERTYSTGTGELWVKVEEEPWGEVDASLSFRLEWVAYGGELVDGCPSYYSTIGKDSTVSKS